MGLFSDVTIDWKGKTYTIPAKKLLRAIAEVEEIVTLGELAADIDGRKVRFARLSRAFASALRFAGAVVTDDEVYYGMFDGGTSVQASTAAVTALLSMMIPPSALAAADKEPPQGNGGPTEAAAG